MDGICAYEAPAKINLYLDVIARRKDGYHDIETLFQAISLRDTLEFREADKSTRLSVSGIKVPTGADNLVMKAVALVKKTTGCTRHASIKLNKNIPTGAGLGGGSSDAAATLLALNDLWNLKLKPKMLNQLAAELGADVPYFLTGGTVAAVGRGDQMAKSFISRGAWFVLVFPGFELSTRAIYAHPALKCSGLMTLGAFSPEFRRAVAALSKRDWAGNMYNALEAPAMALRPELKTIKERLLQEGCPNALMSGSGSTVFGACDSKEQATAVAGAMTNAGFKALAVASASRGCRALGFM